MITANEIRTIIFDTDPGRTEGLARRAQEITQQQFGRTISLYAPLYLSNYCSSQCTYCGFHSHNKITRFKLTAAQMHREMAHIASHGIENILLLTGESYTATPLPYIQEAVTVAKKYFSSISIEMHPMEEHDYRELFLAGVDGVTVYQETYNHDRYTEVHIGGKKADYEYRYDTPRRAARAGIRYLSLGILLGLSELANDLYALYTHLHALEKEFPGIEYSISFPRLQTIKGKAFAPFAVADTVFIKSICLTRILFPRVGINLSTREHPTLRDQAINLGVTRISAGSKTTVGGYAETRAETLDPQFDVADTRSVAEIIAMLKEHDFDPVLTDWRHFDASVPPTI